MSAMRAESSSKRPPTFTTSEFVEVEVDIDPEDLERAGWIYVGKPGDDTLTTEHVLDVVKRWHDDNHDGPWRWCAHELCDQLRGRDSG